jgi:hypothetical protein
VGRHEAKPEVERTECEEIVVDLAIANDEGALLPEVGEVAAR